MSASQPYPDFNTLGGVESHNVHGELSLPERQVSFF